jgi:hypothetical protein
LLAIFPFKQVVIAKMPFFPHDVNDVNSVILCAIKNANWWNDKLAILSAFEFGGHRPALRMTCELLDSLKNSLNKLARS